jgi:hypothetical protein
MRGQTSTDLVTTTLQVLMWYILQYCRSAINKHLIIVLPPHKHICHASSMQLPMQQTYSLVLYSTWHMISLYETKACVSTIICPTMHETTTKSSLIFLPPSTAFNFFSKREKIKELSQAFQKRSSVHD